MNEPDRTLSFIQNLRHTKGPWGGKRFILDDWEEKIIRDVFGNLDSDGKRIVRTAYIESPKKCGKSTLAAAVSLKMLAADDEPGAEIYSAAADKDQASVVFDQAAQMVYNNPVLSKRLKILDTKKRILRLDKYGIPDGAFYQALTAAPRGKHGINPSAVIFDELHTQRDRRLWDVLTGSSGTRRQPLTFCITNSGSDRTSICWQQHEYARKVLNGDIKDPSFYAVLYNLPETDDWKNEENWLKVNPALGKHLSLQSMREKFQQALNEPSYEMEFRRWYLGQWTQQLTAWLPSDRVARCFHDLSFEDYAGRDCFIGLDLSTKLDLTAMVLIFPMEDGFFDFLPFFWLPNADIQTLEKRCQIPFQAYANLGYIELTDGMTVDYNYIERRIEEIGKAVKIQDVCFDPWNATQVSNNLMDKGYSMVEVRQTFQWMSDPTKNLEALIMSGKARLQRNPIFAWNFDNTLIQSDRKGNIQPTKCDRNKKIDGVAAAIIGLSRAYDSCNLDNNLQLEVISV